ncbi:MAG: zinc metallopeptidase [Clostridia bacterium]|nr:zinc metallopeptidase [Clostridia bacterium]
MIWYDYYYYYLILVLPAVLISVWAQIKVKTTFAKYSEKRTLRGTTAADVSRGILNSHGLFDVNVTRVSGDLTDHFDPRTNKVSLSDPVYSSDSIAAIGVAAHECGHAIQHAEGYKPVKLRTALVPITNFGSSISIPLIMASLFTGIPVFFAIGIVLFSLSTVFQLVTLPVEFNASRRAVNELKENNTLTEEEIEGVKKVLGAAALTYVAALLVSLMSLLRLLLMHRNRR